MQIAQNSCASSAMGGHDAPASGDTFRFFIIGVIGFLTLSDLFGTQAILPLLASRYGVSPGTMGVAVNASTFGMAVSGLLVAMVSRRVDRRNGVWISLLLLSLPTLALAGTEALEVFAALRVIQGLFMAAAFTFTMAYLAEHCTARATTGALAAYVTGGVASNFVGRLIASATAGSFGVPASFVAFAALNVAGAVLAFVSLSRMSPMAAFSMTASSPLASWAAHLRNVPLRSCFAIGFLILFAFIGVFTYVNFVLAGAPLYISTMTLGFVYFVFLPSMLTTPLAGLAASRFGTRTTLRVSLGVAGAGLPLLLYPALLPMLAGLTLVGIGTFFAQATATGFIGRAASTDRAAASGLYLASYYLGGLAGAAAVGRIFDVFGWPLSVAVIALSLHIAALLAKRLMLPQDVVAPAMAMHAAMRGAAHRPGGAP